MFKNGSTIDILAARQSSRGQRRTGGAMEECILIDGDVLNEVIIPTTNVDRRLSDGSRHKEETVNKSQVYITTAGWDFLPRINYPNCWKAKLFIAC